MSVQAQDRGPSVEYREYFGNYFPPEETIPVYYDARIGSMMTEHQVRAVVPLESYLDGDAILSGFFAYNHRQGHNENYTGGFIFRWIDPDRDLTWGIYALGDFSENKYDHVLGQFSIGFDVASCRGWELSANYYHPDDKKIDGNMVRRTGVMQHERGVNGGDISVRFELPFLSEFVTTQGEVGGYFYDNRYHSDFTGLFAGVKVFPLKGVSIGFEYHSVDRFHGDHWMGLVGVSAPLGSSGLFSSVRDAFSPRRSDSPVSCDRYLDARLITPVERRNWVTTEYSYHAPPAPVFPVQPEGE